MKLKELIQSLDIEKIEEDHKMEKLRGLDEREKELEQRIGELEVRLGKAMPSRKRRLARWAVGTGIAAVLFFSQYGIFRTMVEGICQKQNEKIEEIAKGIGGINNDLSGVHNDFGILYSMHDRKSAALYQYDHSIELDSNNKYSYHNLGRLYISVKEYGKAEQNLIKAIKLRPDYAPIYGDLGYVYLLESRYAEAESNYKKAIELDPSDIVSHRELAALYKHIGKKWEAGYYSEIARNMERQKN